MTTTAGCVHDHRVVLISPSLPNANVLRAASPSLLPSSDLQPSQGRVARWMFFNFGACPSCPVLLCIRVHENRRAELSAVVRIRSPVNSSETTEPPDLYVRRDGPRHVSVEAPECRTTPKQKESFEVTRVLPLNATPEDIFAGVGGPVVDWLWDGFNAVVLSYGQARSGKTSLLVGNGEPSTETPGESSQRAQSLPKGNSEQGGIGSGKLGNRRRRGDEEGLLKDMLRDIFDKAAAAGPADAANPVLVACQEKQLSPTTGEPPYETLNPLAGSWSPSRHANDSPGFDVCPGGIRTLLGTQELTHRGGGTATVQTEVSGIDYERWEGRRESAEPAATADQICGSESMNETWKQISRHSITGESGLRAVVALSAWEVAGKHVTDLFLDQSPDSGSTGGSSNGRKNSMGNSSNSIEVNDKG
ncbi:unnamed protein product, partial [Ectocarpus sp. 12 AP-2014]